MRVFIFFFTVFALLLAAVDAREDRVARLKRQLLTRQSAFNGPTTVTTTRTAETFAGTVIETCTITLTPVAGPNGENLVREERKCSTQLVKSSATGTSTIPASTTSAKNAGTTSVSTVVVTATAVPGSSAAATSTSSSSASVATSVASSSSTSSTRIAESTSSVATSSSASVSSSASSAAVTSSVTSAASSKVTSTATSSAVATGGPAKEIGTATKSGSSLPPSTSTAAPANAAPASSASSTNSISATAAAAESSASATPFTLPGKKLEVLPIGLGVFAGISVIALIVVGLVTYERTKYRKAFRQRKLAEQGAGMGYNGMSERV